MLSYIRDEDHLALFMELLGNMPRSVASTGKHAREYFNRNGKLRHIRKLRYWPLEDVLAEKYDLPEDEVSPFCVGAYPAKASSGKRPHHRTLVQPAVWRGTRA